MGQLTETSTMWQIRAMQAEEQLKQLTAGTAPEEAAPEAAESPQSDDTRRYGVTSMGASTLGQLGDA